MTVPATPAAQPYGAYRPSPPEHDMARIVEQINQPIYWFGGSSAAALPKTCRVH